jgi:hypothetical protein
MLTAQGNVQNLQSLLSSHRFSVPDFQRNYAWEETQIDEFWNDIEYLASSDRDSHFIGSLITYQGDSDGLSSAPTELIDGQQRMTTIYMLLSLIRDEIYSSESTILPAIPNSGLSSFDVGAKVTRIIFASEEKATPRFVANTLIRDTFHDCVLRNPTKLDQQRKFFKKSDRPETLKLRKAYWKLSEHLKEYTDKKGGEDWVVRLRVLNDLLEGVLTRVQILQINTTKMSEAINIYMTLNNRGLGLTPSDLVKSLLMKHITEGQKGIELEKANTKLVKQWQEMYGNIGESKVDQFLRHYLLVYLKEKRPLREADIYSCFENIVEGTPGNRVEYPKVKARQVLDEIMDKSITYGQLLLVTNGWASEPFFRTKFEGMNSILDGHRVFLLGLFDSQNGITSEEAKNLLLAWETFTMRWVITGGNAQIYENFAQSRARDLLIDSVDHKIRFADVVDEIRAATPNDEAVAIRLKEPMDSRNIVRYVLFRINESLIHDQDTIRFDPKTIHVEHICPETGTDFWHEKFQTSGLDEPEKSARYEELTHLIGNQSLLEFKLNSSIKNDVWEVKLQGNLDQKYKGYSESSLKVTQDLLAIPDWTIEIAKKRTTWVVDSFLRLWSHGSASRVEPFTSQFPDVTKSS